MESDKTLGLPHLRRRRRRTKAAIPITANMTAALPMTAPTITGVFDFLCGFTVVVVVVPLAFILSTGALREGPSQA
jgi:hypothetical protein